MAKEKWTPEIHNPCWGCEFRKKDEPDYINVCLLEGDDCPREKAEEGGSDAKD